MSAETDRLRAEAHKTYGTNCSQRFCKAGHGHRLLHVPFDMQPVRDPAGDGTWITVQVFIADYDDEVGR